MIHSVRSLLGFVLVMGLVGVLFFPDAVYSEIRQIDIPVREGKNSFSIPNIEVDIPRVTLALSGGSARGAAHIGVLDVLDSAGIKIDGIVGTSIGAFIGLLYASGWSPGEIIERVQYLNLRGLLLDQPSRRHLPLARKSENSRSLLSLRLGKGMTPYIPGAISPGQELYSQLLNIILDLPYRSDNDWAGLKCKLAIVASDMVTGNMVLFDSGDPAMAVRASMSVPLLFDPIAINNALLIDGGIAANLPTMSARSMDGNVVVAVDVTSPLSRSEMLTQPWQIVDQVTTILTQLSVSEARDSADFVIVPNFDKPDESNEFSSYVEAGRSAARAILPELLAAIDLKPQLDDDDIIRIDSVLINTTDFHDLSFPDNWLQSAGVSIREIRRYLAGLYSSGDVRKATITYDSYEHLLCINVIPYPIIKQVEILGNSVITTDRLIGNFTSLINKPYDFIELNKAFENTLRTYRQDGYPVANIQSAEIDSLSGTLTVHLDEGIFGGIRFYGLNRVPESGLEREIPLKNGLPFKGSEILRGMANLYATGLFRSVYPMLSQPEGIGSPWILEIHVSEHPSPQVRIGLSYQNEHRTRGLVEMMLPSLVNYAARFLISASFGQHDQLHFVRLEADRFFGYPLTYNSSAGFFKRDRITFDNQHVANGELNDERWGGSIKVGGEVPMWGSLQITGRLEQHFVQVNASDLTNNNEHYRLAAVGSEVGFDTQDRNPFPTRGVRTTAIFETARKITGSQREFNKGEFKWEGYVTPVRRHTLGVRFTGCMTSRFTPIDEQPRLGGMHSLPGLHLDELIDRSMAVGGVEYRFDLLSRILADSYIGIRLDVGATWKELPEEYNFRDWLPSSAIYLAFDTLFGPIQFQWGHLFSSTVVPRHNVFWLQLGNTL